MAKYSRMEKYKGLRSSLQNDSEADIHTNDLYPYTNKLNQIDPEHFSAPETPNRERSVPGHVRQATTTASYGSEPVPGTAVTSAGSMQTPVSAQPSTPAGYSKEYFQNDANYTRAFNNEYLDDYIREVKEYNINQGIASNANTDLDILKGLQKDPNIPSSAPLKPYPDEPKEVEPARITETPRVQTVSSRPAVKEPDTADISFGRETTRKPAYQESTPTSFKEELFDDYLDDEDDVARPATDTQSMTKEDIAAEVQRLINNAQKKNTDSRRSSSRDLFDDDDDRSFGNGHSTRQQILAETMQMRTQLGDYEDGLNDVNDKVKHTNQILNIVLIILIIALSLVLAVVVYWVLLSKGVIS